MKLFTKIALGIAGFFGSVAVICAVIALAFGFTLTDFQTMVRDGKFNIGPEDGIQIHLFDEDDIDMDIDLHHGDSHHNYDGEERQYDIPHVCTKIYVEYGAGTLDIRYADVSNVQVIQKNVEKFSLTTSDVEESVHISGALDMLDYSDVELTILIPRGTELEKMKLEIGASQMNMDEIVAEEMSVIVGAGEANLSNLSVEHLDIEVGAGQAEVKNLQVENLDVEAGVGEVDIEIIGAESDYSYDVECGIGEVNVGNHAYGGVGAEQHVSNPNATKKMDIECGIGEVTVKFME